MLSFLIIVMLVLMPILSAILIGLHIEYICNKDQTINNCKEWNYVSFDKFLEEFNGQEWEERTMRFEKSFFCHKTDSEVHAGIIRFNDKGMVIRKRDFIKWLLWERKNIFSTRKDIWK